MQNHYVVKIFIENKLAHTFYITVDVKEMDDAERIYNSLSKQVGDKCEQEGISRYQLFAWDKL